jgi:menaquinone-dependent protoporphyrinogen IX oxidase
MKYLVTYWSQTGNTKKVAEAIYRALPGDKSIRPFHEVESLDGIDLIFIGHPVMQFGPPASARQFIGTLAMGKKIALFVTHALPGTSEDPVKKTLLEKELQKCRSLCSNSELIGLYHCQGELSEKTARELMDSNIPMLMEFAGMRDLTTGHPDQDELHEAVNFAISMISV